jgi:hypothetical protein
LQKKLSYKYQHKRYAKWVLFDAADGGDIEKIGGDTVVCHPVVEVLKGFVDFLFDEIDLWHEGQRGGALSNGRVRR